MAGSTPPPVSGPSPAPLQATDPRRLGRYQIVGRLGQGGMGTVYFGRAPDGTPVAIKVIKPELAERPEFRARFRREAESAQRVRRFTTAAVLDADPDGLYPYLVTEYVEGPTLSKMVARRGPLRPADLEQLALSVATALSAIHAAGIVHRDLTPANVLLSPVGPKVIDFGLARDFEGSGDMSRTRAAIGTPGYMAPEQIIDAPVTSAADVFAWGAITIFAATGRPPFGEGRMEALLYRILHEPANAEGVPPELVPLVDAAMRKEPERRPTAEQLRVALMSGGALPADVPPAAGPATPGTESQPRRRGLFGRGGQRRQSSEPPVSGIRPVPATTGTLSPPPGTSPVPAASGPVSPAAGPVPAPGPTYSPPPAGYPPTAAPVNPAAAATWSPATQTPRSPAPAQPTPPPVPQSPVPQSPVPRSPTPTPWPQPAQSPAPVQQQPVVPQSPPPATPWPQQQPYPGQPVGHYPQPPHPPAPPGSAAWAQGSAADATVAARPAVPAPGSEQAAPPAQRRRWPLVAAGVAVLTVAAVALPILLSGGGGDGDRDGDGGAASAEAAADQLAARAAEVRAEDIELAERLSLAAYRLAPTDAASRAMLESFTAGWHSELPAVEPATYRGVALSPGADRAAAIDTAGTLRLWDTSSPFAPTELATVPVADASSVVFLPSGELVIGGNAAATVWDVGDPANPRQIASLDTEASDSHLVAVSGDGSELVTAGSDRRLDVWDMSDPSQPVWLQLSISGAVPTDIALSPSGNVLAVAGVNGSIELWDLTEPTSPRRAGTATGHVGPVNAVAFIADDRLASGGDDSSVRVWDVANPASPAQVTQLRGHDGSVVAVAETASGSALVSAGHDGTLLGWDLSGDAPSPDPVVIKEAGDPFVLAAADDSAWVLLAAAETPDLPKLGSLDPATLAEQACQDPRVRISEQEWSEVTDLPYRDPCQ